MEAEHKHRVKFYSVHDLSAGGHLRMAEVVLQNWEENISNPDINTILELYNIKLYFDSGMRLKEWTDEQFLAYKRTCDLIPGILGKFCNTITDSNFSETFGAVQHSYLSDFWALVCDYKIYDRIQSETLKTSMDSRNDVVWHILCQKSLVLQFGQVIAEHLVANPQTASRLILSFLAINKQGNRLYFPNELTQEMRDKILLDYVDKDTSNLNVLRLLAQAQSNKDFPVSDRLRLKARKKAEELQEKLFANSPGISYGIQVSFVSGAFPPVEESVEGDTHCLTYSREWIEYNPDYPTLLNNFIYLFEYVDNHFRSTFPSLSSEMGLFESHIGLRGKKEYEKGGVFELKQLQSQLQMAAYLQELQRLNIRIEDIFKWFFENYLKEEFHAEGFTFSAPSEGTTYAEKCKLLAIAIDGALKQFRLFCGEGVVDRELLEMSSGHIFFRDLCSMRKKKYAYSNTKELYCEQFLLYSDQSLLCYSKEDSSFMTLPSLLLQKDLTFDDFAPYQQCDLRWLIDRSTVLVDDAGYLRINKFRAFVLMDLFLKEFICPVYYSKDLQHQIDELVEAGEMRYEDTLFSKPEQDYLNYILNQSEFSNGLDLRNKYSHDTGSLDEKIQHRDYLELLKIFVLIIIKINEEFCQKARQPLQ